MLKAQQEPLSGQQHWLNSYGLRLRQVMVVAALWAGVFYALTHFEVDSYLDVKIADPINFRIRDFLGKSPVQNQRLKIWAIDDKTFAALGTPMPSLEIWADVLYAVVQRKPKLVMIDAMFSANQQEFTSHAREVFHKIKSTGVPIVTGAFASPVELPLKDPLRTTSKKFELKNYRKPGTLVESDDAWAATHFPLWQERKGWHLYGPTASLSSIFDQVGHIYFAEDSHKVEPFLWLGGNLVAPHATLYPADELWFENQNIVIDGKSVALDRHGRMPINFMPRSNISVKSMIGLIRDVSAGRTLDRIGEGDIVVLLPLYFTGNTDLRPSPFAWVPGGLHIVAMFNSLLNKDWLQPVLLGQVLTIIFSCVSALGAFYFSATTIWGFWLFCAVAYFAFTQICFAYAGLVVPYIMPLIAGAFAGVNVFALKLRSAERKTMALRAALDGAVSPSQLKSLMRRPDDVNLEPRERIVTLMFIDVVGFSLSSEDMAPREAFDSLKRILASLSEIVHDHGGIVDKSLGDGLLCYFGYRFDTDKTDADHPEKALSCAIKIQEQMLEQSRIAGRTGAPIYPLRIGVNTASCYLGDLGSGQRIEFTVVGNGVNFAKRLESSCNVFCIMIGSTTYDLIKGLSWGGDLFARKAIKIKHHSDLRDAIEVNPFNAKRSHVEEVLAAFRKNASFHSAAERMHVKDIGSIQALTAAGAGMILDFTGNGLSVRFDVSFPKGEVMKIRFESRNPGLGIALQEFGIEAVDCEVRWAHTAVNGFVHGIMLRGINSEQQEHFVRLLSAHAFFDGKNSESGYVDSAAS